MADDGPEGASDADELRSENERLRAELAELKESLRVSVPARRRKKRPQVADEPEPERAYVLVPGDTGRPAKQMLALARVAVESAAKAMPTYTWSSIDDTAGLPVGTVVLHVSHVCVRVMGGRKESGVPAYEVAADGELTRIFEGGTGGEAFEALFFVERSLEFYEREAVNPKVHAVLREAWRRSGEITRLSLELMRAHWEGGDDDGDSSWRAAYASWQESEEMLMTWLETNAARAQGAT